MNIYLQDSFFLSASDADAEGFLSLTVLTSKIIDIATQHANSLGIGNPTMEHLHAGWILSRITIEMIKYPKINSNYLIKTWILDYNRHFSTRCFSIESTEGEILGYARTIWLVLDYENHTNFGTSHLHLPAEMIAGKDVPIPHQEKHIAIFEEEPREATLKKYLLATHMPVHYTFKYCDLDSYRHVNTIRYIVLLMNQFSLKQHDEFMIERIELSFLHEASYGMETTLFRSDKDEEGLNSSFQLSETETGQPLLYGRVKRRPRQ